MADRRSHNCWLANDSDLQQKKKGITAVNTGLASKNLYFSRLASTGSYINGALHKYRLYWFINRLFS